MEILRRFKSPLRTLELVLKSDVIFIRGKSERANTSQVTGRPEVDVISMHANGMMSQNHLQEESAVNKFLIYVFTNWITSYR